MDAQQKKELTAAAKKQDNILSKLKILAKDKQYGYFVAEIKIHNGCITEIRHRDHVAVIR